MAGRAEARKVVEEMGKQNGYLPPHLFRSLPPEEYEDMMDRFKVLRKQLAASVKILAQNLYSSSAKFVFELLQNYDDNRYTNSARGRPSVAFSVYHDRILASCNEDGFTAANVRAICNVGQSSKKAIGDGVGYTGEKGIGFKSVFMAAEAVHIQSGDYSFRFQYAKGDSGLGMTTPIWTDHDEQLDPQRSHISLTLRRDGGPGEAAGRHAIIQGQFQTIHDSILLFMRKLEQIDVALYDDKDVLTSVTSFSVERQENRATVTKRTTAFGKDRQEVVTEIVKHYVMIRHVVSSLAPNENRDALDGGGEQAQPASSSNGVVVLGFPMDAAAVPVLQNEYLFAFLPVKQMGFKFLIHADFVTQANREDIVTTSERNLGLAKGIADAFIQAVLWFRSHDTLQYTWMRYLPHDDDYPWGSYWAGVIRGVRDRLAQTPVLRPAKHHHPHRLIRDARRLPNSMLDAAGRPLIADRDPERYLSQEYEMQDLLLLTDYGLADMSISEWLDRVQHDLASPTSAIKSSTNQDWDTRVADLLTAACNASLSSNVRTTVRQLELIPLRDNKQWISASTGRPVYYPHVGSAGPGQGLDMPLVLDMHVVEARAASAPAWRRLYDSLGVQAASVAVVRKAIFDEHGTRFKMTKADYMTHLQFIYLTHHLAQSPYGYNRLYIMNRQSLMYAYTVDVYTADGGPYGVELLLPTDGGAPGLEPVFIVDDLLLKDEPSKPALQTLSWRDWLHDVLHVRRHLRLVDPDGTRLSTTCHYVAKHRPDKFLGFLQATWGRDQLTPTTQKHIVDELGRLEVLCRGGQRVPLRQAYVPLDNLKTLASGFLADELFPWLELEVDCSGWEAFPAAWVPLGEAFGLGYRCSRVAFLMDVLWTVAQDNSDAERVQSPQRIYALYARLQAEIRVSPPSEERAKEVQLAFESDKLIFIPACSTMEARWVLPDFCVWDAPVDLFSRATLARLCAKAFPDLYSQDRSSLQDFFSRTLHVRDCRLDDLVHEIVHLKEQGKEPGVDFDTFHALYKCLLQWQDDLYEQDRRAATASYSWMKSKFTEQKLICGFEGDGDADTWTWYSPAQCLWTTSSTQIPGMLTLNGLYPELHGFFVEGLGVQSMTAKMVYDKLMGSALTVQETKETLEAFNALLAAGEEAGSRPVEGMSADALRTKAVFPVQMPDGGGVQLCRGVDSFALVDRLSLADAFAGRAKLLDFDLDTTRTLQPFFAWVGLQNRALSKMVKEIPCVAGDDSRPIASRDRSIRRKARALFSLALAYKSPRAQGGARQPSLYALLRGAETLETDKITSELHLHQDGYLVKAECATATFHIQDNTTSLVVHVPRDEARQELCFNDTLPQRVSTWLMTVPTTQICEPVPPGMVHAVQSVLCAKLVAMEAILDHHGIHLANVPDGEEDDDGDDGDDGEDGEKGDDGEDGEDEIYITSMLARSSLSGGAVSLYSAADAGDTRDAGDDGYAVLLDLVVQAARQATIPVHGASGRCHVPSESSAGRQVHRWLRNAHAQERYKQIGAAGELFVFELLSHLERPLPGFSREDWQSTIRDYAQHHAEYADMPHWTGQETADITYADVDGALTALLIEKGYLSAGQWSGARPHYYIEVKTTVNAALETPFFLSSHQYTRMQTCSGADGSRETVYMIVRVFGLGAGFVGFRLLVDPESMRRHGELVFRAPESWSVVVL